MSDSETKAPEIPDLVDWSAGDKEPSRFVTNMIILNGDSELTLLLYEVLTPYVQVYGPQQEKKWTDKWMSKLPIQATCHGRFVFTPERCEQLIDLLQQQLSLYWENVQKRHEELERMKATYEAKQEATEVNGL